MPVYDKIVFQQGQFARLREYPTRNAILEGNKALQSVNGVKELDGMRIISRMPVHERERLADKARAGKLPSYMADLDSMDGETKSKATKRLLASSDGKEYLVGTISKTHHGMPKFKYIGNGEYKEL